MLTRPGWLLGSTLLAAAFACACSSAPVGETKVGRKELYRVDNPKYDELFEDVFELQKESATARDEEKAAREPLARVLAAGAAPGEALAAQAGERAEKMALGKPKLVLGFEGLEPSGAPILGKASSLTPPLARRKPWAQDPKDFTGALEETLRAEAKVVDKFAPLAGKARRRLGVIDKLRDWVPEDLKAARPEVRDELERELAAAKPALTTAATECELASAQATKFLRLSVEGLTAAAAAKPEPKTPAKKR